MINDKGNISAYPKMYAYGHPYNSTLLDNSNSEIVIQEKVDGSQFSFGKYDGKEGCSCWIS